VLPKKYRLTKKEIEKFFQREKVFYGRFVVLKKIKNFLPISRFGFVISQKISKKAVLRNKIKRRLNEVIQKILKEIKPGYDIVFFVKKGIEKQQFLLLKKEIEDLLKKVNLLKDDQKNNS